ncbi:pseudouridine synthase [Lasiosphaeria miniovina]|uniref:Pseudouridine synthase n=1 Tax=Lasiosphaeria miniovina TaxID=1954250 RepID=A0AA40A4B8_9PEZI|nr:pseudouridine synthase [Lasiosphaeria miniovina]KAK0709045.1 pseudouridine synthase [Lasiosphaeria miniovina]
MTQRQSTHVPAVRTETEKGLGITQRSCPLNFSWSGDVRKRYTDFLVYEIRKDGTVLHLNDFDLNAAAEEQQRKYTNGKNPQAKSEEPTAPKPAAAKIEQPVQPISEICEADRLVLAGLINEAVTSKLIEFDQKVQAKKPIISTGRNVAFDPITDRTQRATVHQEIRRIFSGRIETVADNVGVITASPSRWAMSNRAGGRQGGRDNNGRHLRDQALSFAKLGGEFLHFTLYKENKDTMDAINTIARLLKIKASNFSFAGTKDRRAGTVQRISVYRQRAANMLWLNSRLLNVKLGDFKHETRPLQLGQHGGNEFVITIKNCMPSGGGADRSVQQRAALIQQSVECGLAYLKHNGYINYYGLQRFGTHAIGTHLLGMKVLKGDYEGVIEDILHVDEETTQSVLNNNHKNFGSGNDANNRDDYFRAKSILMWKGTKNAEKALEGLPKRFSSEAAIIRHLGKSPKDFMGAILSITRGMRMMYIHAYQSYVWNYMATRRWSEYGNKVVEGDLVLLGDDSDKPPSEDSSGSESVSDLDDDSYYAQAHLVTAEDIASNKYNIFDVVLPTPGYDVMYPRNVIGDSYVSFMKNEENGGMDPYDMRRRHKEFSLSGNYRHVIGRFITEPQYGIRLYSDDTKQMYPTDLDFCNHKKALEKAKGRRRPPSPTTPRLAHWGHFANNAEAYDDVMAADRRRKASQEPVSDGVVVTNETWVETGLDGSSKRVKLAQHDHQFKTETEDSSNGFPMDTSRPPIEADASLTAVEDNTGVAEISSKANSDTVMNVSPEDPHSWYGAGISAIPRSDPKAPANTENDETGTSSSNTKVAGVEVPVLRAPSDNPISSPNTSTLDFGDNQDANKIAVILKFQLKTSNYATVVLRELMGTTVELA